MSEKFYPTEKNLGKNCEFWHGIGGGKHRLGAIAIGCGFPKATMEGRLSCEGIVDDVCLYLRIGRHPESLTDEQVDAIRYRIPNTNNRELPPGDIH
ncbi:MAG: hypothetical protein V4678_03030 [Patescibacteria group bacterium]